MAEQLLGELRARRADQRLEPDAPCTPAARRPSSAVGEQLRAGERHEQDRDVADPRAKVSSRSRRLPSAQWMSS